VSKARAGLRTSDLETALAHASDAILIVAPDGTVAYANPRALRLTDEIVPGRRPRVGHRELERLIRRAIQRGHAVAEDVNLSAVGTQAARVTVVPLDGAGSAVLVSDISESYRLDQVRRDFVANVSHELKTPVATIRALAETAATAFGSDDLDAAVRFVERLGSESARLAGLVSDLLDLSRVEAGGELERTDVDLESLLVEACDRTRADAELKDIKIVVQPTDVRVLADPSQVAMALKNLVDNAVRYSEGGTIELTATRIAERVVISVSDEGIGIPADEIPRIFERFYRVDKARSRATGGTGLGLAIVRHVVENHGGEVSVNSAVGVGSTVTMSLPWTKRPAQML
jgi:two-component system sensor histidine kinase SenX3